MLTEIIGTFLGAGTMAEISSRYIYRKKFKLPWRSKVIGEYPYDEFIEQVPAPLYFQFKKNYSSKYVNINSLGLRGEEPKENPDRKKLLLIGESMYFGAKILNEKLLWSYQLKNKLEENNINNWEIYNAGFPGYNSFQYAAWWENSLRNIKPDILILQLGGNDITQAFVMGERWEQGIPWDWEFMLRQQKKSKWWQKLLYRSCLYFLYRRKSLTARKGFEAKDRVFKLEECIDSIIKNAEKIILDANSFGAKVILIPIPVAYDLNSHNENPPQLDAIQSNWKESLMTTGIPVIEFYNYWLNEFAQKNNSASLDLQKIFWNYHKRYEIYLDIGHWNGQGHKLTSDSIYNKIKELGWW